MKEVHEFMLISGEGEDGTEGQPDSAAKVAPIAVVEYEARRVVLKTTTVKTLKAITAMFKLSAHGKKELLFNRIHDSSGVTKVSDDKFEYLHSSVVGVKVPTWVILTPEDVPPVNGIDMSTGAAIGFFGPTNKENAVGGKRSNFLTIEPVERPKFEPKKPKKRKVVGDSDANNNPAPSAET